MSVLGSVVIYDVDLFTSNISDFDPQHSKICPPSAETVSLVTLRVMAAQPKFVVHTPCKSLVPVLFSFTENSKQRNSECRGQKNKSTL